MFIDINRLRQPKYKFDLEFFILISDINEPPLFSTSVNEKAINKHLLCIALISFIDGDNGKWMTVELQYVRIECYFVILKLLYNGEYEHIKKC